MKSLKLKAIAFFIEKDDRVVDIGCDHAYLGIYLEKNNLCKYVLSSDINKKALQNAVNNIKRVGLSKKLKTALSDGLNDIEINNINTVVIAGMGTKTIKHILKNKEKFEHIEKIILSSNNEQYELRKFMMKNNYILADEKIILENKHYYVISKYIKGKQKLNKKQLMFGLTKEGKQKYYKYLISENKRILKKVPIRKLKRRHSLKKENKILKKLLKSK